MGAATVLALPACHDKKSSPKEDDNQEKIAEAKKDIPVSAEDSAICVDVFTRYLNNDASTGKCYMQHATCYNKHFRK